MAKKIFQRYMPDHAKIREHKHLQFLGDRLHQPNLWHLNRRSVSYAFAVGLFAMYIPLPTQMVMAAVMALAIGANLPISVALVWITNPVTMPPVFYACYKVGAWLMGMGDAPNDIDFSIDFSMLGDYAAPFLLGCLVLGVITSSLGFLAVRGFWRWHVINAWEARRIRQMEARGIRYIDPSLPCEQYKRRQAEEIWRKRNR